MSEPANSNKVRKAIIIEDDDDDDVIDAVVPGSAASVVAPTPVPPPPVKPFAGAVPATPATSASVSEPEAPTGGDDEMETEIRDTDIVFDCPHCGHNLAIDYRGAGLQITCVNCGESVLVPIPDGMKIDDLDIEPGEILKQLFAARRNLQRLEFRIEELEQELRTMTIRRDTLMAGMEFAKRQLAEFEGIFHKQAEQGQKASEHLASMMDGIATSLKDEVEFAKEDGGEDGAPSK